MRALAVCLLLACLLFVATGARADEVQVVSPRPDTVSVTIYRDLFALISETRTVDLPAGPVTLVFDGVTETLIPQSTVITDVGRPVATSNFDFDRMTPANLLRKSIGRHVTLTRMNPATGKLRQIDATVIAANQDGIVFHTDDGNEALHCSGLPEQVTFDEIPGDLETRPTLSIHLAAGAAGSRQVKISYLAHGFAWNSDYVAHLNAAGDALDLLGWLTLENLTGANFRNAQVQVVAGKLNLLGGESGGSSRVGDTADYHREEDLDRARDEARGEMREEFADSSDGADYFGGCYPLGTTSAVREIGQFPDVLRAAALQRLPSVDASEELQEIVVVTGARKSMALREGLADYQMYRLPARTDLAARQTKQVAFLHKPAVKIERFYSLRIASDGDLGGEGQGDGYGDGEGDVLPADIKIGWTNREQAGLGEPLPGGIVRFFDAQDGLFAGDARIKDSGVGAPVELTIAKSIDVGVGITGPDEEPQTGMLSLLTRRAYLPVALRITNAKPVPVSMEIRQGKIDEAAFWRVTGASLAPSRKAGDYVWRFTVPANGERTLTYKIAMRSDE